MSDKYIVQFTGLHHHLLAGLSIDSDQRAIRRLSTPEYREIFEELTTSMVRLFKFSNATVRPWEASHNHLIEFSGKRALLVTSFRYTAEQMKADIERGITVFFFIQLPLISLSPKAITEIAKEKGFLFLEQSLPQVVYTPAQEQSQGQPQAPSQAQDRIIPEDYDSSLSNAAFLLNKGGEDQSDREHVDPRVLKKLERKRLLKACLNRALLFGKLFVRKILCVMADNFISGLPLS